MCHISHFVALHRVDVNMVLITRRIVVPAMDEDLSVTSFGSSSADESLSYLISSVNKWVEEGQPIFNELLSALHTSDIVLEPVIETFVFSVVGGYTYNFSQAVNDGMSVTQAHSHSLSLLMQNPKITDMTEAFLSQAVENKISKVVE